MRNLALITVKRVLFVFASFAFTISFLQAQGSFFDSAGVKIHYTVQGRGEPVLLIHGFGQDHTSVESITKELKDSFQVIAIDVRGHGQSGKPHDPNSYGMQIAEDCVRLLDHMNISKVHVVGYSMGGRIAASIVGYHPGRLRSAIFGGYGWEPPGDSTRAAYEKSMAESLEKGSIAPLLNQLNPPDAPPLKPDFVEMVSRRFLAHNDPLALAALMRNPAPSPLEAQLRANKVPALLLIGELDGARSRAEQLNGIMSNLKVVVIPQADHLSAQGSPEFLRNLREFLVTTK